MADAYAAWNIERQEWELVNTFDKGAVCDDCDGETRIKERELDDARLIDATDDLLAALAKVAP